MLEKLTALRALVCSIVPYKVQTAVRAGCSDIRASNGGVLAFVPDCVLDLPPDDIAAAAEILKADSQLVRYLTFHVSELSGVRSNLRGDIFEEGHARNSADP